METLYPVKDARRYKVYKHSDSTDDLDIDWREYLADGEAISSQTVTSSNITVDSESSSGQVSTLFLSGGNENSNAYVDISIITDNATARTFKIRIHFYFELPNTHHEPGYYY